MINHNLVLSSFRVYLINHVILNPTNPSKSNILKRGGTWNRSQKYYFWSHPWKPTTATSTKKRDSIASVSGAQGKAEPAPLWGCRPHGVQTQPWAERRALFPPVGRRVLGHTQTPNKVCPDFLFSFLEENYYLGRQWFHGLMHWLSS